MGLLLIAAGICFGFILLANQEILYWQANQKKSYLRVADIPDWPYSAHYSCRWLVSFNRLIELCRKHLSPTNVCHGSQTITFADSENNDFFLKNSPQNDS